jgi:hypothetical protein
LPDVIDGLFRRTGVEIGHSHAMRPFAIYL